MKKRKELKTKAKRVLRKHYWLLIVVCLLGTVFGTEFSNIVTIDPTEPEQTEAVLENGVTSLNGAGTNTLIEQITQEAVHKEETEGTAETEAEEEKSNKILGRRKGVFAMVVNSISSGALLMKVQMGITRIVGSENLATNVMIVLSMAFFLFLWIYIQEVYVVVARRIFLEARTYDHVGFQKFLFLMRVRRWSKTAWNMVVLTVFQVLWDFTIIGGFIKHYSYYMVPYILAENPDMGGCEAVTLSRRIMRGHKWECFKLELSFLLWDALGIATIGVADVLFTNAYKTATFGEYYACLRRLAREKGVPGADRLNDRYLFEKPDAAALEAAYGDIMEDLRLPVPRAELTGFKGLLSRWFGIVLTNSKAETAFERAQAEQVRLLKWKEVLEGKAYPDRLFPIKVTEKRETLETILYARNYSVLSLVLLFFSCSFIGWLWEVSLHLIMDGEFVNRGVLHGPWLPIYGSGSVLILVLLKRFRNRPVVEFTAAVVLCGFVEYMTSWYLQMANGQKWWDYTGYFLNLNGRICAEGLLVFGLGGMAIVYIVAPLLDNLFRRFHRRLLVPLCVCMLLVYGADQAYSLKYPNTGKGITDYGTEAEHLTKK